MMRLFDYLFYRLYIFYKKKGEDEFFSVIGPSFFVATCLGCLLIPAYLVVHRRFWGDFSERTTVILCVIVCLWSYLRYRKRKDRILSQFRDSSYNKRIHIFFVYLMIPVCTLIGVLFGVLLEKFVAL